MRSHISSGSGLEDEEPEEARAAPGAGAGRADARAPREEEDYFDGDDERDEMDDFLDDDLGGAPEGRRRRRARSGLPAGTSAAAMRVRRLLPPCMFLSLGCSQKSSRLAHSLDEMESCRS